MKRFISIFMLLAMLVVVAAGCGSTKNTDTGDVSKNQDEEINENAEEDSEATSESGSDTGDTQAPESASEKNSVFTEGFFQLESSTDILNNFKEFGYTYTTKQEDQPDVVFSFHYVSLGKETIDGKDTDHIKVTQVENGETTEFEGWYINEWYPVKYVNEDGELIGEDAGYYGAELTMFTQLYANKVLLIGNTIQEDGTVDEMMFTALGKRAQGESKDFGTGSTPIDLYDFKDKFTTYTNTYGISNINGSKLYTVIEAVSEDSGALDSLRITKVVPR